MATGDRISIVSDEISQDLSECRAFLDDTGIAEVEIRCVRGSRAPDLSESDVEILRGWVDDGIRVNALSPGIFKGHVDDHDRAATELDSRLPRTLELADKLMVDQVIAFSFENPDKKDIGRVAEVLARATETCRSSGARLLVENEPGFTAATGEEANELLSLCGAEGPMINWDPANSTDRSVAALTDSVRLLGSRIGNVHVKNGRSRPQDLLLDYGPLSDGEVDWPAQLRALATVGYDGPLALETHYEPLREASLALVSELREMVRVARSDGERTA